MEITLNKDDKKVDVVKLNDFEQKAINMIKTDKNFDLAFKMGFIQVKNYEKISI